METQQNSTENQLPPSEPVSPPSIMELGNQKCHLSIRTKTNQEHITKNTIELETLNSKKRKTIINELID